LLVAISEWRTSSSVVWSLHGPAKAAVQCGFYGSWISLFYSLWLSGLGYQTGWTPWWHWVKRRPLPRREFRPRSLYHLLRHPVYLSFLGLIWFTPRMSLDHAVLTGIWTIYIFFGSYLKDERLAYYLGETYRSYQSRVAGYPLFPGQVLGRRRSTPQNNPLVEVAAATKVTPPEEVRRAA
jgi:protein-S-isoprenylcysteine O-methyltransferase Ste14